MGKKNIFKPDPEAIIQNLYASFIYEVLRLAIPSITTALLAMVILWNRRMEFFPTFYLLVNKMNTSEIIKSAIGFLIPTLGFTVVILAVLSGIVLTFKKAIQKHTSVKDDDFVLEKDSDGAYIDQYMRMGANLSDQVKLWLVLRNGSRNIRDCRIVLENLAYLNGDVWEESYTSIERKPLKWRVGYIPPAGKIDIAASEKVEIELARSMRHPFTKMELSYLDGYSGEFLLEGTYKLFLMIDAKLLVNNQLINISPIHYEVVFQYKTISQLKIKEIKKIE